MTGIFEVDGFTWREIIILVLFAILFAWIACSFWIAVSGAVAGDTTDGDIGGDRIGVITSATGGVSLATMAAPTLMASSRLQLSTKG